MEPEPTSDSLEIKSVKKGKNFADIGTFCSSIGEFQAEFFEF